MSNVRENPFNIDATSKYDIHRLVVELRKTPNEIKIPITSFVLTAGLMVAPWYVRLIAFVFGFNNEKKYKMYYGALSDNKTILNDFWKQFLDHIENGKDRFDKNSAGGYSQKELDVLIKVFVEYGFYFK